MPSVLHGPKVVYTCQYPQPDATIPVTVTVLHRLLGPSYHCDRYLARVARMLTIMSALRVEGLIPLTYGPTKLPEEPARCVFKLAGNSLQRRPPASQVAVLICCPCEKKGVTT